MGLHMTWQHNSNHQRKGGCGPPLGLKNLGNTCYLNSVLQCLTFTPPLAQFCLSFQHSSLCKSMIVNREKECPFCILERQIVRSLSLEGPLESPSKISKCIMLYAQHFRWGRQEDAHEFLRYVIDACHNTCLKLLSQISKVKGRKAVANGNDNEGEDVSGRSTVMKEIFGGALLSQVKCLGCKAESNKTDEIMDISLDLCQSNSLKDALGRFFHPEVLDGNNKYSCSNCKKLCVAKKQMFIQRAPNVLVIQLKRFEGIHGGKISRNIEFEEFLAITKYMCTGIQDSQPEYSLYGSIVHAGYSPESGHYYAYVKDAHGRWYCCDDTQVSPSSTQQVLSEKVYILFYIRSNQSPKAKKCGLLRKEVKSDSNGTQASSSQKPAELVRPLVLIPDKALPCENNVTSASNNGRISANPQIRSFTLKKTELKKVVPNGNGEFGLHNNPSVMKQNGFIQSSDEKKNKLAIKNGTIVEFEDANKVRKALHAQSNVAKETSNFEFVEKNIKQTPAVANKLTREGKYGHSSSKTKPFGAEAAKSVGIPCREPNKRHNEDNSSWEVADSSNGRHHIEELEEFKRVLAEEACSLLQSSGWVERVHNFMRNRKRIRVQSSSTVQDASDFKQQLINDARKNFISQIPESLKEHLVERLRSFSEGRSLFDS